LTLRRALFLRVERSTSIVAQAMNLGRA
jgi:hypothetical protein